MKKNQLLSLLFWTMVLWTMVFLRASLITGCLLVVYSAVYTFLNAISAIPQIDWFYPVIGGTLLFIYLLINDAAWVSEKKEKYKALWKE